MNYRNLTDQEIGRLTIQQCQCEEWDRVQVVENFDTAFCRDVHFSGDVRLGLFGKKISSVAGIPKQSGIYSAHIHNCTIEDNVYIRNIANGIANYTIESDVFIENVELLAVDSETTFGNGVMVPVMNEQGGRAIPMFTELTAQIAYLLVFYRHRSEFMDTMMNMIEKMVDEKRSTSGVVGTHSRIVNCETITNTAVGAYSYLHGVKRLNNATVNSSELAQVEIGNGVIADSVIVHGNSTVTDGSIVDTCFLAEGCELAKHFSAENSLFFSNFIGHHGEAFAIFAGPHTATHHKSTLLISAYFSFLNAGSGSNQSNHMYKLGPLHQGVVGRGSKTGSNSYVLWPANIGAFTLVLGRHMNHPDVSELPYSYLIEEHGESVLIPGVNLKSVGTIRDADKWPVRDKRSLTSNDLINYDLLSPYSVGKMKKGQDLLETLHESAQHNERRCYFSGTAIPYNALEKGIHYYKLGITKYVGNQLAERLQKADVTSLESLHESLIPTVSVGEQNWIDMCGMVAPRETVEDILDSVEQNGFASIEQVQDELRKIHESYDEYAWRWCSEMLGKFLRKSVDCFTVKDVVLLLDQWISATEELDDYFLEDAMKEFGPRNKISFGIDGEAIERDADFTAVRGDIESNDFIEKVRLHTAKKSRICESIKEKLKNIA